MRRLLRLLAPSAIVAVVSFVAVRAAAAPGQDGSRPATRFTRVDPSLLRSNGAAAKFVPASLSDRMVHVVLELGGDPVAVQSRKAKAAGSSLSGPQRDAVRAQLRAQQSALHGPLANAGARIVGEMQDAYNGIHVIAPQKSLPQLANMRGVVALHSVKTFRPVNVNGVPFIGGPQVWGNFGFTGRGVKVAVIDTGIDYTHADFAGPGTVAAFQAAAKTSTAPADPTLFGPNAPKVKGGFDFVGDAYNASDPNNNVPHPDPNPLDCNSHGTHTAGTAAGFGVRSDGSTYRGPYNASIVSSGATVDSNPQWNVGPGVAPEADIYAYRVFGCNGSSNIVDLAIDRAVQDGVDVISMSLGSDLGGMDDPTSVASQNAFNDGIAVVAAAGNAGPGAYVTGSPATANGVLSAAAMDASFRVFPGANLALTTSSGGSAGTVTAIDANNATLPSGSFPVKVLRNSDGSISLGCNKSEYSGTAGKVVVTVRGTCARVARAVFGDEAGAAAVVMINNSGGFPPFEGTITGDPDTGEQHLVHIPFLGTKNDSATVAALNSADGGMVSFSSTTVPNSNYKLVASFSSGGPRNPDSAPKPEIIAPGVSVTSAGMGTGTGGLVDSGTSMATPMTSGTAALVKQAHPNWNGAQIKAAIMNTADPSLNTGYNVREAGAGVVQAQKAVNSSVLASTADNLDSLAFGFAGGSGSFTTQKAFTLTNFGASTATYDFSIATNASRGESISFVGPTHVVIPSGQTAIVRVSLTMSATAFANQPTDDTFNGPGPGNVLTARGEIIGTPASGSSSDNQTLHVPYVFVPRGLSNVTAGPPSAFSKSPGAPDMFSATLPLSNSGIHSGDANLFAWGIHDPNQGGDTNDIRDVGVQVFPGADFGSSDSDRGLVFVVNGWNASTNQSVNEYDILIDNNGDGVPDFVVVGADLGAVLAGAVNGQFASFTINASNGNIIDAFFADAPMNSAIAELPALASELGLSQAPPPPPPGPGKPPPPPAPPRTTFTYSVNAFSEITGAATTTGSATFTPFQPAVSSGDFATLASGTSTTFTLTVDRGQLRKAPALGWLVVSVDDASGAPQATEVSAPTNLK